MAPSVVGPGGDRESGLIVLKDAGACARPAVGTVHGGIPEIIVDGETGFLVAEHDPAALAEKLDRLVADDALRERMGRAARERMEREYDQRVRVAALEDVYDELAGIGG
jgi:glycosyltransferase involved in cell wall biosynthesis